MKRYLGIDVGGTKIKYGVFKENGEELTTGLVDTERNDLNKFINTIVEIKNKYDYLDGVGVSLPCVLNSDTGEILEAGNITALEGINIKNILQEKLGLKVEIENDANCVALAEKWIGNGKDNSNFICVTIGTGIGGAIIINDKIYKGNNFVAGEFGFMVINNPKDGGLEKDYGHLAATTSLVELVKETKKEEKEEINGHYIFNKISSGDLDVIKDYNKWLTSLAVGIRNLCFILDPEKVLIGGGVSAQEKMISDLSNKMNEIMPEEYNLWSIESCKYFNQSGMLGAIYNFIDKNK